MQWSYGDFRNGEDGIIQSKASRQADNVFTGSKNLFENGLDAKQIVLNGDYEWRKV